MIIDGKAHCHICGIYGPATFVKCKADCDGLEQEFCETCRQVYLAAWNGEPNAFEELKARRAQAYVRWCVQCKIYEAMPNAVIGVEGVYAEDDSHCDDCWAEFWKGREAI